MGVGELHEARSGLEGQDAQDRLGNCERRLAPVPRLGKGHTLDHWIKPESIMNNLIAPSSSRRGHSLDQWTVEVGTQVAFAPTDSWRDEALGRPET